MTIPYQKGENGKRKAHLQWELPREELDVFTDVEFVLPAVPFEVGLYDLVRHGVHPLSELNVTHGRRAVPEHLHQQVHHLKCTEFSKLLVLFK